jgi:hypothetical protein
MKEYIYDILNSENELEVLMKYSYYFHQVKDYCIIYESSNNAKNSNRVPIKDVFNKNFTAGCRINSLFQTNNLFFYDPKTIAKRLNNGSSEIPIDLIISLDTQAVSYFRTYINKGVSPPSDFLEVINYLFERNIDFDPLPYLIENYKNMLENENVIPEIFDTLKAYETLRTLNYSEFIKTRRLVSLISNSEINSNVQKILDIMLNNFHDPQFTDEYNIYFDLIYISLMKIIQIQFISPKKSLFKKFCELLFFFDTELSVYIEDIAILAIHYFNSHQLRFFSKIHKNKNKNKLLYEIQSMAGDLLHIFWMKQHFTFQPKEDARYIIPTLLSFDKRFSDIFSIFSIKSIAFKKDENEFIVINKNPITNFFNQEQNQYIKNKFFLENSIKERVRNKITAISKIAETKTNLLRLIDKFTA